MYSNGILEARITKKKTQLLIPWTSNIAKILIRNTFTVELHLVKRISSKQQVIPFFLLTVP